jgi:hypothetical protein
MHNEEKQKEQNGRQKKMSAFSNGQTFAYGRWQGRDKPSFYSKPWNFYWGKQIEKIWIYTTIIYV